MLSFASLACHFVIPNPFNGVWTDNPVNINYHLISPKVKIQVWRSCLFFSYLPTFPWGPTQAAWDMTWAM